MIGVAAASAAEVGRVQHAAHFLRWYETHSLRAPHTESRGQLSSEDRSTAVLAERDAG
jgi:hypothetical protein